MAGDLLATARWECCSVTPGDIAEPAALAADGWLPATVPGTAAGALRAAGRPIAGVDFDGSDWWFRTRAECRAGPHQLQLDGIATVSDVWVNGRRVLHSDSMFARHQLGLELAGGAVDIAIRCAALAPLLALKRPRPRWRSGLVAQQGLRWFRTTLLGRMPGWAANAAPVGPWRLVRLRRLDPVEITERAIQTRVVDGNGFVEVRLTVTSELPIAAAAITVGTSTVAAVAVAVARMAGNVTTLTATVRIDDVELWWPHTHGAQPLYPLTLQLETATFDLGTVGFRTVAAERAAGAFNLSVNGVPFFARGACWVPPDPISLNPSDELLREALRQYVDAGFNLVRITGTMTYESATFWRLCAELGLFCWQDAMFATLDPPADADFEALVIAELRDVFAGLQGNPAIVVISGGSESEQQPAMLGLSAERRALPLLEDTVQALAAELLPGVPYITSSPTGGVPPTRIDTGVSHYFGVGAYLRPLSDARTAGVRFAAECLAFATPPDRDTVEQFFGGDAVAAQDPRWQAAVPRDNGASWDFEDVRDHYVKELFRVDPAQVRRADPQRALDLGRATVAQVVQDVFSLWRRPASGCAGGVVLSMRDLMPGAGWGLVDSTGAPKAPWYAAARVLAKVAVFCTDEGLDGVAIHVANDGADPLEGALSARLFGTTGVGLESVSVSLKVPAHRTETFSLLELLGEFRDLNHAYRFGPATYDAVHVSVADPGGVLRCEATHLLLGQARPLLADIGLDATAQAREGGHELVIATRDLAQWVSIDCPGYRPADSWFHLVPGASRTIALRTVGGARQPAGFVRALNCSATTQIVRQ